MISIKAFCYLSILVSFLTLVSSCTVNLNDHLYVFPWSGNSLSCSLTDDCGIYNSQKNLSFSGTDGSINSINNHVCCTLNNFGDAYTNFFICRSPNVYNNIAQLIPNNEIKQCWVSSSNNILTVVAVGNSINSHTSSSCTINGWNLCDSHVGNYGFIMSELSYWGGCAFDYGNYKVIKIVGSGVSQFTNFDYFFDGNNCLIGNHNLRYMFFNKASSQSVWQMGGYSFNNSNYQYGVMKKFTNSYLTYNYVCVQSGIQNDDAQAPIENTINDCDLGQYSDECPQLNAYDVDTCGPFSICPIHSRISP